MRCRCTLTDPRCFWLQQGEMVLSSCLVLFFDNITSPVHPITSLNL
uniref:Uncharacterized protein n=1 Tax=Anguilla anguilla TaxID=7936 RepID=A0A0E9RZV5_ANGAN